MRLGSMLALRSSPSLISLNPNTVCAITLFTPFITKTQRSCPEDSLDAATLAGGYKWVPDALRITEANEPLLSLTCHNAGFWEKHNADALRQVRNRGRTFWFFG